MRVLVVIPTYNEVANIAPLASEILAQAPEVEVLFVDDSSPDGTAARVSEISDREPRIRVMSRPPRSGFGTAILAGLAVAMEEDFDVAVTMDGDRSHAPVHLRSVIARLESWDMVIGSRYIAGGGIENWGLHRRLLSRFANWYSLTLLGLPVRDCTSGYRGYRVEALRRLPLSTVQSTGYSFLEEILCLVHRNGLSIGETPIVFTERRAGRSKISQKEIFLAAYHVIRLRLGGRGPTS